MPSKKPVVRKVHSGPKVLFLDIETAPNLATVWSIWNQNIAISQLLESSYTLCWAAKWMHSDKVMFDSVKQSGKEGVIKSIWKLVNEADIVIHYNGRRFDMPVLNREFLLLRLPPPTPYKQIDLYVAVKKKFQFVSHKLDYVAKMLGMPGKIKTTHQLWLDCMNGKADAWKHMKAYNINDVIELEKVYKRILGWIEGHPNMGLWAEKEGAVCPNCGGDKLHSKGLQKSMTQVYRRYQCQDCGKWSRSRYAEKVGKSGLYKKDLLIQVTE